jgi:hypothetical protein
MIPVMNFRFSEFMICKSADESLILESLSNELTEEDLELVFLRFGRTKHESIGQE